MRPYSIAIFAIACLMGISAVCVCMPEEGVQIGTVSLRMPDWREVTQGEEEQQDTVVTIVETMKDSMSVDSMVVESASQREGEYAYLNAFYHSLSTAKQGVVRVMHYGDSQLECDRMTKELRTALQKRYGGGGVGLIPLVQTIPAYSISQSISMNGAIQDAQNGPKRYMVYGPKHYRRPNACYGVMGQMAVMNDSLVAGSEDIILHLVTRKKGKESFFNRIHIFREKDSTIVVPDSTSQYDLHLKGKWDIYGVSLENDCGIVVDNIPMRGCAGYVFTDIRKEELQHFYQVTNTRLIILQFGGNVMPYTNSKSQVKVYVESMRQQIKYLRSCAPDASFLFVGPSDMLEAIGENPQSYPMLGVMDSMLREMAHEESCAYWSLLEAMGGPGSMHTWMEKEWAGSDGIHFSPLGAQKAGRMLTDWIMEGEKEQ